MAAGMRRFGFCLTAAVLAVLLFFFSSAAVLWMLLLLLGTAALSWLLTTLDAGHTTLTLYAASGAQTDRPLRTVLSAHRPGRFLAAGEAVVELEISNIMFGSSRTQRLVLPLRDHAQPLETMLHLDLCGETVLRCTGVAVWDALGLFCRQIAPFPEVRVVCYPASFGVELALSRDTVGAASTEGLMQNRKGNDPSEIFDVREYVPGDDIRSIHWKLSCKTDTLILREPSDPSHYDAALLPDLGLTQLRTPVSHQELNAAAALTVSLGEQMLQQGESFCLAIPTAQGLRLHEVRSLRELYQLLPQWLGLEIQAQSGVGLQCFLSDHLEQYFTRLLIVSAGKYSQDLTGLGARIGVTAVSTAQDASAPSYTALGTDCEAVVLPAVPRHGSCYRIVC